MSEREQVNCEVCHSFLHKTFDCPQLVKYKAFDRWVAFKKRMAKKGAGK